MYAPPAESGTTSYTYPTPSDICSGEATDVCTRTDNRGTVTTYTYSDPLNRVTSKTYSDGTPAATFSYDESSVSLGSWTSPTLGYPNGRLTHTTTSSGGAVLTATVQDYDKMGRTADYWQCTPVNCGTPSIWGANYTYDLAGDVTQWNHPAGFTISQPVDGARHVMQVTSSVSGSAYPATLASGSSGTIQYTAWGAVGQLQNGCAGSGCTNIQETFMYNNRMQMAVAELGTSSNHAADSCREYSYYVGSVPSACSESPSAWPTGTNNNGNAAGYYYNDNVNYLGHTAAYTYDSVNRLSTAAATGDVAYNETFTYTGDGSNGQFGNMGCSPAGPGCVAFTYNPATNQITTSGYAYDLAGNVTNDGTNTYQWDAESHLAAVYQSGNAVSLNTYNALGQRVEDITPTSTTDEAYGADGELLLRYTGDSNSRSFVPFGGGLLAEYFCGGMMFDHPDGLGSLTTSTDCTGSTVNEKLFYPFGESWTGAAIPNLGAHQTFAKLPDYDPETDQYNTANRHYSPMGRWMSPDPGGVKVVKLEDPQTWNMYAYVRNNPLTLTDPTGLDDNLSCEQSGCPQATNFGGGPAAALHNTQELNNNQGGQNNNAADKPAPQPAPTDPKGNPTPPPVKVPGAPDLPWKWNPNPQNPRGGTWGPDGWKGPNPPNGSWDPSGHWDINGGKGEPVDHYDPKGNPITPGEAHPGNIQLPSAKQIVIGIGAVGTGYLIYRGVRMLPSVVFPPLWPTIPLNAAIP